MAAISNINPRTLTRVIISSASNVSESVNISQIAPRGIGIGVRDAWTAADIGFEVSENGSDWFRLRKADGELVLITGIQTAEAGFYVGPSECWGAGAWNNIRLLSLDAGDASPENQSADRVIYIVFLA